jgi:hypothetical protein
LPASSSKSPLDCAHIYASTRDVHNNSAATSRSTEQIDALFVFHHQIMHEHVPRPPAYSIYIHNM